MGLFRKEPPVPIEVNLSAGPGHADHIPVRLVDRGRGRKARVVTANESMRVGAIRVYLAKRHGVEPVETFVIDRLEYLEYGDLG